MNFWRDGSARSFACYFYFSHIGIAWFIIKNMMSLSCKIENQINIRSKSKPTITTCIRYLLYRMGGRCRGSGIIVCGFRVGYLASERQIYKFEFLRIHSAFPSTISRFLKIHLVHLTPAYRRFIILQNIHTLLCLAGDLSSTSWLLSSFP